MVDERLTHAKTSWSAPTTEHALSPYLTPAQRDARFDALCADVGASVTSIGRSVDDAPILAATLREAGEGAPAVMVCANIHGLEWIGVEVAHSFLSSLRRDPRGHALLRRATVHVLPCLNPDGYARTFDARGTGTMRALRWNARGVDLNRNFPLPHGRRPSRWPGAGSTTPGDATYRGVSPLSEPESRAVALFLDENPLHASVSLHSFMGTLMMPMVLTREDAAQYRALGRAFRSGQTNDAYRTVSVPLLDVFTGELEDHQHHVHRTWAVCVECFSVGASIKQHLRAPRVFWRMNPRDPSPVVRDVVGGIYSYFDAALNLPAPRATP